MEGIRVVLLAAGVGSRLVPLTNSWPKCLMPIHGQPLLEYWLSTLHSIGIKHILINTHHHAEIVNSFLARKRFVGWIKASHEIDLLGTAGTLIQNAEYLSGYRTILIHADNWCQCNFSQFVKYHIDGRPTNSVMTMMTFRTSSPHSCGIVELDKFGMVHSFHEKVTNPPSNLANGAVYMLEPSVIDWILERKNLRDFSTDVVPQFIGKIATWENEGTHRDIGTLTSLLAAQSDTAPTRYWDNPDSWEIKFRSNPIHQQLSAINV